MPGAGLVMRAAREELDQDQDADGHQQPGREQNVKGEAEDGQGRDGDEGQSDDREHGDRSPFTATGLGLGSARAVLAAGDPGGGERLVFAVLGDQQPGGDIKGQAGAVEQN
jgi:hypothetical protein